MIAATPPPVTCTADPAAVTTAKPVLPKNFQIADGSGRVATIAVTIDDSGKVTGATVYHSSGIPQMDAAAISAAKRSTFAPGKVNCEPVGGTFAVDFNFAGYGPSNVLGCPAEARLVALAPGLDFDDAYHASPMDGMRVTVRVSVTIEPDGRVSDARVAQSSGNATIDRAVLKAARGSTYAPKMIPVRRQAAPGQTGNQNVCQAVAGLYIFAVTFEPN